jgi:membrane protein YqaA with SNARE-associated domain
LLRERLGMRGFSKWIVALFTSPLGVIVLAALDSTLFFSLPFGIDAAVIILAARLRDLWWTVPLLATLGSVAGAALTFWMGGKIGEKGLDRWVPDERRLERIRARIREKGAIALAVLDLIPPPFPFTPFVLAAGALEVDPRTFFGTLAACRIFRFGLEAALAIVYGRSILGWLDSDVFHDVVAFFIVAAGVLTTLSIVKLLRSTRAPHRRRAAA